ncbi:helix-turn-helix domain-containing protein [Tenacibaculum geojense]|uniref:Helix-turn-helix domain-containing protein n=1 Tax=Tenacibaculum geojense TaxID=915352 RepID=A0ABW3JQH5_9FLAO
MNFQNTLIFFFSALGAFNSIILSGYFIFFAKPKHPSNYFLGALLAVASIRVWKSLFFYFDPSISKNYLQVGLSACFLIGPFLYFYVASKITKSKKITKNSLVQITGLFTTILGLGIVFPYKYNITLWTQYFYPIINIQWLLYILATAYLLRGKIKKLITKEHKINYDEIWLMSVFFGILIIWTAYNTASYTSYIVGALSFSFVFYLSTLLIFLKRKKEFVTTVKKEKYANANLDYTTAKTLLNKLEKNISSKKLYTNPNLTLPLLAKEIGIRPQILSELLNNNLHKSFNQYINEYRIEEAKNLLKTHPEIKIEIIAEKCGYNSKSTFYTAFKKITNTTPAKYNKNL